MKTFFIAAPLVGLLGLAVPVHGDVEQHVYDDDDETEVIYDEVGEHPEDGIGDVQSLPEYREGEADASGLAAFEQSGEEIAEDVYGEFDPDFNWTTDDDSWDTWYEHTPQAWSEEGETEPVRDF